MSYLQYFESKETGVTVVSMGPDDCFLEGIREVAKKADIHTGVIKQRQVYDIRIKWRSVSHRHVTHIVNACTIFIGYFTFLPQKLIYEPFKVAG